MPEATLANDADDTPIWGAAKIAEAAGVTKDQAYHLLEQGRLPARKVGGRWVSSRARIRKFLVGEDA